MHPWQIGLLFRGTYRDHKEFDLHLQENPTFRAGEPTKMPKGVVSRVTVDPAPTSEPREITTSGRIVEFAPIEENSSTIPFWERSDFLVAVGSLQLQKTAPGPIKTKSPISHPEGINTLP